MFGSAWMLEFPLAAVFCFFLPTVEHGRPSQEHNRQLGKREGSSWDLEFPWAPSWTPPSPLLPPALAKDCIRCHALPPGTPPRSFHPVLCHSPDFPVGFITWWSPIRGSIFLSLGNIRTGPGESVLAASPCSRGFPPPPPPIFGFRWFGSAPGGLPSKD